jgi:hypothetical protein
MSAFVNALRKPRRQLALAAALTGVAGMRSSSPRNPQQSLVIENRSGLRVLVAEQSADPIVRLIRPGLPSSDRSIEILFPEHVTVRRQGAATAEQLYLHRPGSEGRRPEWRRTGSALEYERRLRGDVQLLARATLENDGLRIRYEFHNRSEIAYDMVTAVTDPRLTSDLHDVRLERTYVHRADGFQLLGGETPERLTMPLDQWLPARYLASFTWPVPAERVQRLNGVTHYYASRSVDSPFIATLSADRSWVIATLARDPGNVWSNPELTCQHADPQRPLPARGVAVLEVKILLLRGSLDDVLRAVDKQRDSLR